MGLPGYRRDSGVSKNIELSSDPVRDLKQGKTVVRNIRSLTADEIWWVGLEAPE